MKLVNLASNVGALFTSLMSGKVFIALGLIGTVTSVLLAGVVWPRTFGFWARLGKKKGV